MTPAEILGSAVITFYSLAFLPNEQTPQVLGDFVQAPPEVKTVSSFRQKEETEEEPIPYPTKEKEDADLEIGQMEVLEEGINGKLIKNYLVTYWQKGESDKTLIETTREEPTAKVIAVGTKVVWRKINTPDGERKYWMKIPNVWATSYDKSCAGCNEWTALGTKLDIGTCAVDPKKIKLWTEIFVPEYGICRALDVGGSIKGNKIDVGFYDLHAQAAEVGWTGSHWTDIYLLDQAPE
ncbi:MAG: G5 domain-containing protein [Patescibacteria group bacterium]